MTAKQSAITPSPAESDTPSEHGSLESQKRPTATYGALAPTAPALASQENQRMEGALGDAVLRFLRIRKGPKADEYDPDSVLISLLLTLM